jgi:hypothetical protein
MSHTVKDCLHCAINKIVERRAQEAFDTGAVINLPEWIEQMVESIADLILVAAPAEEHRNMLVHAVTCLEKIVTTQSGQETETTH